MPVSKPGVEQVIDLINTANELALNTNLVSLGVPTPTASGAARNTTVTVYPSATLPGLKEPVAVYYDRVDMSEMYGQAVVELEYDPAWVAHQDIMLALNDKFGVFLNNEDVVNTILDFEGIEGWPRTVILTAASNSYYCRGTLEISLIEAVAPPFGVATYNDELSPAFVASGNETHMGMLNESFARFVATDLELGLRLLSEDADSNFVNTPSDAGNSYPLGVLDDRGWYLTIGLSGSQAPVLAAAERLQLRVTSGSEEHVFPIGWDTDKYTLNLGGWVNNGFARPDGSTAMFRLLMSDAVFGTNFDGLPLNSNNSPLAVFEFALEVLNEAKDAVLGKLPVGVDAAEASQDDLVAHPAPTLRGLNGVLYLSAESALSTMDNGQFESVLGGQPGYYQGHARHARIVDDSLYIDFNYIGYASQYTGTITGIELYGCDPVTGAIVETLPVDDITNWNYSTAKYTLVLSELNASLAWRAKLSYNLINEVDSGENMVDTIDVPVFASSSVQFVSINGVPYTGALSVSESYSELTNSDYIVSVLYDDGGANSVGYDSNPNTAVVSINGVEHTFEFDMIGT